MCTKEQGVGCDDIIKDYDVIIVMSELMTPRMMPFPTIIYEFVLIPFILTWSLCDMCVCVSLSVCLSVQARTFETISRSSLSIKVTGPKSSHGKC